MDVGAHLRTTRQRLGLSIADIAVRTKISARVLRAIETGDTAALPPRVFVRGFIRTYALELRLDPEPLVASYLAQFAPPAADAPAPKPDHGLDDEGLVVRSGAPRDLAYLGEGHSRANITVALVLAAFAFAIVSYLSMNTAADAPAALAVDAAATAAAVGDTPASETPVGTSGQALTLDLYPSGPCWVEVRVDGEARVYRLMQAGERETVHAAGEVRLRVGDPTVFAYSINGRRGRPLGITSQPVTVRLRPDALDSFLQ